MSSLLHFSSVIPVSPHVSDHIVPKRLRAWDWPCHMKHKIHLAQHPVSVSKAGILRNFQLRKSFINYINFSSYIHSFNGTHSVSFINLAVLFWAFSSSAILFSGWGEGERGQICTQHSKYDHPMERGSRIRMFFVVCSDNSSRLICSLCCFITALMFSWKYLA